MDIDVQNFDAGFIGFADEQYSNLSVMQQGVDLSKIKRKESLVQSRNIGLEVMKKIKKINFKGNPKQQMWINAFRQRSKQIEILNEKLKIALVQGKQTEKKALENQLQSLFLQVKQLVAQNEDLLKNKSVDAIPLEVVKEEIIVAQTPEVQPDGVPANLDESAPVPPQVEDIVEEPTNKNKWIVPALVIGVVAYFIFKK
jgi:hypothetical protein